LKRCHVIPMGQQRLDHEKCVLGVVAAHAVPEKKTVFPHALPFALDAFARQALRREAQRIPHGRTDEDSG